MREKENSIFSIYDPLGVKLLTCLRVQSSPLNKHKYSKQYNKHYVWMRKWSWNYSTLSLALLSLFSTEIRTLGKPQKSWFKFFELKSQRQS